MARNTSVEFGSETYTRPPARLPARPPARLPARPHPHAPTARSSARSARTTPTHAHRLDGADYLPASSENIISNIIIVCVKSSGFIRPPPAQVAPYLTAPSRPDCTVGSDRTESAPIYRHCHRPRQYRGSYTARGPDNTRAVRHHQFSILTRRAWVVRGYRYLERVGNRLELGRRLFLC